MLRAEHVIARYSRGALLPHRLSPENGRALEVAQALVALYAAHEGKPKRRLEAELSLMEEELGPRLDARRGFRILRALAKLLEEKAAWAPPTEADPYTLRTRVFELAAAMPELPAAGEDLLGTGTREEVLSQVARETGVQDVVSLMHADRQGAQVLASFEAPAPEDLIARYNVAQVQGVLYGARGLTVELGRRADARLVFRYVKLLGLIYALETLEGGAGHRLRLDGPLSLFGGTRKYGLRLAKFLPGLLLTSPWKLRAEVAWKGRDAILELDSETSGLSSHLSGPADDGEVGVATEGKGTNATPTSEGDVREAFLKAWARAKDKGGWELGEGPGVIALPPLKAALVPDFTLVNGETGELVHLEILGFWSERYLIERVELVREAAKRGHRVLVAAPESLGTSPETLREAAAGEVIPFKNRLDAKSVLAALG